LNIVEPTSTTLTRVFEIEEFRQTHNNAYHLVLVLEKKLRVREIMPKAVTHILPNKKEKQY
jgi:hypothetical protein